ncbi:hypothetical protein Y032_0118g781 [Ancylostoma ceylanicum]|uniref:Uncharacterized protein n=1 Tax=Ancylostoma ceylanicum TaxID=53326 RepID=A0A016TBR4_9BILA|nr:hypothetical protein Y032_0118g781 [Ancylostoma ceylanicum]
MQKLAGRRPHWSTRRTRRSAVELTTRAFFAGWILVGCCVPREDEYPAPSPVPGSVRAHLASTLIIARRRSDSYTTRVC